MLLLVILFSTAVSSAHVRICCRKASGNCRAACEELTLDVSRSYEPQSRSDLTTRLKDFCPDLLVPFWKCVDETLHKDGLEEWAGRACCHLAETENCHIGCSQALQLSDLNQTCRYSDEVMLYDCAERKQRGEECCTLARTSECHAACRKSLISRRVTRAEVDAHCTGGVSACMNRLSKPKHDHMSKMSHCCLRTFNDNCQETCRKLIDRKALDVEIIQELTFAGCGMISVMPKENDVEQMWACFLSNPDLQREAGIDSRTGLFPGPVVAASSFNGPLFSPASNAPQDQQGSYPELAWTGQNRGPDNLNNNGYPGYPSYPQINNQYPGSPYLNPNSPYPPYPPQNQYPGNQYPNNNQFPSSQYPGSVNQYPSNVYQGPGSMYPGGSSRPMGPSKHPSYLGKKHFNKTNIAEVGLDVNKLYCCLKAVSSNCKQLCYQTFSNAWSDFSMQFYKECFENITENALAECHQDAEEPCELGCDGLSYCDSFNKKPDLFRSCNNEAENAQEMFTNWTRLGFIQIPQFPHTIAVKNITNCTPAMWKSVVCALQVKPCHRKNHSNKICRESCFSLLSSCIIPDRIKGIDAASVCSHISPMDPSEPCINLEDVLQTTEFPTSHTPTRKPKKIKIIKGTVRPLKSKHTASKGSFDMSTFSPCHNHTCHAMQMCVVNRGCKGSFCPSYLCEPGCKMGDTSNQLVPSNTYISLLHNANPEAPCFKLCRCTPQGIFSKCLQEFCISNNYFCMENDPPVGHGKLTEDASCGRRCICHWGDLVCNKKECEQVTKAGPSTSVVPPTLSTQCKAANDYAPICLGNGLTLPNEEFAVCLGYKKEEYIPGTCSNPCHNNPCPMGETCIHTPKVCLFTNYREIRCPQYQCVKRTTSCSYEEDHVCSKDDLTYNNTCQLVNDPAKRQFDYKGKCLGHCKKNGPVCGVDGVTYDSECQANARFIKMDYLGPCKQLGAGSARYRCPGVKCPTVGIRAFCSHYIPPGACCPTCAGAVKVAYSQKMIDRAAHSLGPTAAQEVFTVESIIAALEQHIKVANCRLFGHLTFDKELVLMVSPIDTHSQKYDVEPCMAEAEKLSVLIDTHNARILSITSTSPLVLASVDHQPVSFSPSLSPKIVILLLLSFSTFFFR